MKRAKPKVTAPRLHTLLSSKAGFGLTTISPLQSAICHLHDGTPMPDGQLDALELESYFGCDLAALHALPAPPTIFVVVAGVRGGKSVMGGAGLADSALHADLDALPEHEVARGVIVAPTVSNAKSTFDLLVGHLRASPALARRIVGDPTEDTVVIRRDDGREVEIMVVAAHRGAVTMRGKWLVGFVLEECALFGVESAGAAVNAEELLRAGETRLVPGGRGWIISSPFGPSGLLYDLWKTYFGKPGRIAVVWAPTRAMNPSFPADTIAEIRARQPDVAAREYDATWLDPDTAYFETSLLDDATRAEPVEEIPIVAGPKYVAGMDPATRGNAWTFVIARSSADALVVSLAREWQGSKSSPLDPEQVVREMAAHCHAYGVESIMTDGWSTDALRVLARKHDLRLREVSSATADRSARYETVKQLLATKSIQLPPVPHVKTDLQGVRKIALSGGVRVELTKTPDGRHCDFAPAIALVASVGPKRERRGGFVIGAEEQPAKVAEMTDRVERLAAAGFSADEIKAMRRAVDRKGVGTSDAGDVGAAVLESEERAREVRAARQRFERIESLRDTAANARDAISGHQATHMLETIAAGITPGAWPWERR